jgi:hypothetical protein
MMVFNPMAFATPQQREQLVNMQTLTKKIGYVIHTEGDLVEVTLKTDDPEAAKLIPQLQDGIVTSVTQMLYQLFGMEGERT